MCDPIVPADLILVDESPDQPYAQSQARELHGADAKFANVPSNRRVLEGYKTKPAEDHPEGAATMY